jgi:aspartate-semialdehyde dehydrogenase
MGYRVVVVGATGNVGREIMNILPSASFRSTTSRPSLRRARPATSIDFGDSGRELKVRNIEHFDFAGWDMALFAAGSETSKTYARGAAAAGCTVIDNSSLYRMDPDVPLIVPEVNPQAIDGYRRKNIIANPELLDRPDGRRAEAPPRLCQIRRVVVSTYQSVSGAGKRAWTSSSSRAATSSSATAPIPAKFTKQIAFNVIPHIDDFLDDGSTKEEWKMVVETKKILDPKIKVTATCVRVPVFVGHSESINIEFENEISARDAQRILREAPGIMLVDKREDGGYVTPVECVGEYATYVSRVREDSTVENGLQPLVRQRQPAQGRGAERGQIAELLGRKHLQKAA